MKINVDKFREDTCNKCNNYGKTEFTFGKCSASKSMVFVCAKMSLLNSVEFEQYTGINFRRRKDE